MTPQHLAISTLSPNAALLGLLTETCKILQCNLITCRMNALGQQYAVMMQVTGPWNAIVKFEHQLAHVQKEHPDWHIFSQRSDTRQLAKPMVPYLVHVTALDTPEVAALVSNFFLMDEIIINDFTSSRYVASQTQQAMQAMSMSILIPADAPLADLRESFILFCDEYNLDAVFEPDRS